MGIQAPEITVYFSHRVAGTKMTMLTVGQRTGISGRLVFNGLAITKSCCLLWFDARLLLL
jgi:hypothetical protein